MSSINKLRKTLCVTLIILILCVVLVILDILTLSSYSYNIEFNKKVQHQLHIFFTNQFDNSGYAPVFLDQKYYDINQACHYILINNILENKLDKTDLDLFKSEAIKSGYFDLYSVSDVFIDNNILNQNEVQDLKNKFKEFIDNNNILTYENYLDLYYSALNLNKIDKFNTKEIAKKLKEYANTVKDEEEKIKVIYYYCSLMSLVNNFDFRNDFQIKSIIKNLSKKLKEAEKLMSDFKLFVALAKAMHLTNNKDTTENTKNRLHLFHIYYSLLSLMNMNKSEYIDNMFLSNLLKREIDDICDNLNLEILYLKLAILNKTKPITTKFYKTYMLRFLNSFRNKKSKALFPAFTYDNFTTNDYYAYKIVMKNFLCEKKTEGLIIDTNFEDENAEGYSHIDLIQGKLYKLIYDKFISHEIKNEYIAELKNQIKSKSKKELLNNYLDLVIWNLIGQDLNKLLDKKDLFNDMKINMSNKNYSKALEQIDLLEMMGMDKKILYSYLKKVFDSLINKDKTIDKEIYLCYLLRFKLTGKKPELLEINQKFDVKKSPDDILIIGDGYDTKYMDIKDYLYYFCLKDIDIVSQYVR